MQDETLAQAEDEDRAPEITDDIDLTTPEQQQAAAQADIAEEFSVPQRIAARLRTQGQAGRRITSKPVARYFWQWAA